MDNPSVEDSGVKTVAPAVVYQLDRQDIITAVNKAFWEFAHSNDGDAWLSPDTVLGRPLWDFISGADTADIYRQVLHWVRKTGEPLDFPYRCDSPECRRFLHMTVSPHSHGAIEWRSRVQRIEMRPCARHPPSDSRSPIFRCSLCNRYKVQQQWLEIEDVLGRGELLNLDKSPGIYHSLCSDCAGELGRRCGALVT